MNKYNQCKFYPCHNLQNMQCEMCFCPIYNDNNCEGNFIILPNGIKDCSNCIIPHTKAGYESILNKLHKNLLKNY